MLNRLARSRSQLLLVLVVLAALGLMWLVQDQPHQRSVVRADALSVFFLLVVAAGLLLATREERAEQPWRRVWLPLGALVVGLFTTWIPAIVAAFAALAALLPTAAPQPLNLRWRWLAPAQRVVFASPMLVAAACLALGYGALVLGGTWRYDARTAGAALHGFVFWFTLLAALVPQTRLFVARDTLIAHPWRLAWLYPLVRLYSLGPWNAGWSFAALLLGGAAALWAAIAALTTADDERRSRLIWLGFAAMVLASFALSTSAGMAAGCYLMLACLLLPAPVANGEATVTPTWMLTGALPFTATFVGVWMLVGAATAASMVALAGVAWLVALLGGLTWALHPRAQTQPNRLRAIISVVLGIAAPAVVLLLIEPVVEQMQGGMTVYGDVNVWPWIGISALDAAKTQVAALPSVAVAGLMAVLLALIYLVARLSNAPADNDAAPGRDAAASDTIIAWLRDEVPWLGGTHGHPAGERPIDRE
jgi:hypothetical protein